MKNFVVKRPKTSLNKVKSPRSISSVRSDEIPQEVVDKVPRETKDLVISRDKIVFEKSMKFKRAPISQ